jgi:putative two-component system response regulator
MNKKTILVVDDEPTNIRVIGDILSPLYQVRAATSGLNALKNTIKKPSVDLILLDVMMPDMNGYEVLIQLQKDPETADIPVIFITAMDDTDDEKTGLELGAVDYITKPVRPAILLARVKTHLSLSDALHRLELQNSDLKIEIKDRICERDLISDISMKALSSLAKTRDNETGNHILRTQGYVTILSNYLAQHSTYQAELSEDSIKCIIKAAPLHDIGKVGIPDSILLKQGKLTLEEFELMKQHALMGANALRDCIKDTEAYQKIGFLNTAIEISNYHHEKWNGTGYPKGLKGQEIPLSARIMALADVFDALISRRCYKDPFSYEESVKIIMQGNGAHFDPQLIIAFAQIKDQFLEISKHYSDDDYYFDDVLD